MLRRLIGYMLDKDANFVNRFRFARKAAIIGAECDTYPFHGRVPPEKLNACLNPRYLNLLLRQPASLYGNVRREHEPIDDDLNNDTMGGSADNSQTAHNADEDTRACIIDGYGVIYSVEGTVTSSLVTTTTECASEVGRRFRHELCCSGGNYPAHGRSYTWKCRECASCTQWLHPGWRSRQR